MLQMLCAAGLEVRTSLWCGRHGVRSTDTWGAGWMVSKAPGFWFGCLRHCMF